MTSSNFIELNPVERSVAEVYKLMIGAIAPRPIALVSSVSKSGEGNLAAFSFFNGVSSNPPCLMISIARKPNGDKKDTLLNIEETGEFVVQSANRWIIEKVVHCGAAYPRGINEMEKAGLTAVPSKLVKPVRVKESAFQMECAVYKTLEIGDGSAGSSTIVVGEIKLFHISRDIYREGKIDLSKYQPMARLGGISYTAVGELMEIPIPKV